MAALPTKGFLTASLKFWRSRKARHQRALKRDQAKINLRLKQLKQLAEQPTTMYDDVTLSLIPKDAPVVAGYTSGLFPTWPKLAALFPKARRVSIAVNAAHDADVLDCEPGDATPAQAPAWIKRQHARKIKRTPVIYCSVSQCLDVVRACSAQGLQHSRDYLLWTAHYTGRRHLCGPQCGFSMPFNADATQYDNHALGRSLDVSVLAPSFWT